MILHLPVNVIFYGFGVFLKGFVRGPDFRFTGNSIGQTNLVQPVHNLLLKPEAAGLRLKVGPAINKIEAFQHEVDARITGPRALRVQDER